MPLARSRRRDGCGRNYIYLLIVSININIGDNQPNQLIEELLMTQEDVFQTVKTVTLEVLPFLTGDDVTPEKSLKDLGANSIDRMEVVTRSLEMLELKIPLVEFGKVKNLQGMVDVLHRFGN